MMINKIARNLATHDIIVIIFIDLYTNKCLTSSAAVLVVIDEELVLVVDVVLLVVDMAGVTEGAAVEPEEMDTVGILFPDVEGMSEAGVTSLLNRGT